MGVIDSANEWLGLVGTVVAIICAVVGLWVKYGLPRQRMNEAANTAILGRPPVKDRSGAVIQPAQPGLVAQVAELTKVVSSLAETNTRLDTMKRDTSDRFHALEVRVEALEDDRGAA